MVSKISDGMRTGVLGAGLMGSEIALVQALAGHHVTLVDKDDDVLQRTIIRLKGLLEKGCARGLYQETDCEAALARLSTTTDISDLRSCQIITEAVVEILSVKHEVLAAATAIAPPDAMIVTNTSTIPISVLAGGLSEDWQRNFVGMHYFSPVSRMKLVEVIPGLATNEETVEQALALARATGKTPILVKDVPGFAVNRVLHVFMIEAVRLVEEGVISAEDLDTACRLGLGHPIGPFELMDATTSSLCLQAQEIMFDAYGERFRPRPLLKQRVAAGLVGGKGARGWRN